MATLNLGRIKPVFRGAYAGGTAYVIDDIVTSGGETFICIQASTGNATSSASHWTKLAEKGTNGTNGTDVGTTLTTQGDILYRDGSGLQRLPKGTANQTLQMNGSANAPTWVTAESGTHVKIATIEHSSNVNAVNFTSCFTSDYDIYKVYFTGVYGASNNYELGIGLIDVNGNQIGSNNTVGGYFYLPTGGGSANASYFSEDSDPRIRIIGNNIDSISNEPSNLELTIYNAYEDKHTTVWYNYAIRSSNNYYYNVTGASQTRSNTSARTLKFYSSGGGSFAGYKGTVYGVKR